MLILSVLIGNKSRNGQGVNGVLCVCLTVSKQVYMISIGKISAQTISSQMNCEERRGNLYRYLWQILWKL